VMKKSENSISLSLKVAEACNYAYSDQISLP
jgi:hypothetical protein